MKKGKRKTKKEEEGLEQYNAFIERVIADLSKYPAFNKLLDKNFDDITDILGDAAFSKYLYGKGLPFVWLLKGSKKVMLIDSYKKDIWQQIWKIPIAERMAIKKIMCLIRTNEPKLNEDELGSFTGDIHEEFPLTSEDNISYTAIYHKDKYKQPKGKHNWRITLLLAW